MTDIEVVKEELYGIDKWVTGLVDLIPTQVYVSFFWKISKKKFKIFRFLSKFSDIERYATGKIGRGKEIDPGREKKKKTWSRSVPDNFKSMIFNS